MDRSENALEVKICIIIHEKQIKLEPYNQKQKPKTWEASTSTGSFKTNKVTKERKFSLTRSYTVCVGIQLISLQWTMNPADGMIISFFLGFI